MGEYGKPSRVINIDETRNSEKYANHLDYGCLSFQMMGSLTSKQLASVYNRIKHKSALYDFLRRKAYTDSDYYNELIGTLALREENYARAINYLSKVSKHYLKTMNICKAGFLSRNPFDAYKSRWKKIHFSSRDDGWEFENQVSNQRQTPYPNAKLDFARKMRSYKKKMAYGHTTDERGLARLMYAIGRRNSFEECWALTQYWRGPGAGIFTPTLQYGEKDFVESQYSFLYDYNTTIDHNFTEELYKNEITASLAMLTTDEAKAKAYYILGKLLTVIKNYGNTTTAQFIKTSCDNWESWL